MPTYKIAFFDIDGTLSDPKKRHLGFLESIPDSAKKAIEKLQENGVTPVLATGRNKNMIENAARKLHICTLITSNGHVITHNGEVVYYEPIATEDKNAVAEYLNSLKLEYVIESLHQNTIVMHNETSSSFFIDEYKKAGNPNSYRSAEVLQFVYHSDDANRIKFEIPGIISDKVAASVYNIHSSAISKATSISKLLNTLDIPLEQSIAFGDEENDIEMFKAVGFSVCMGNGNSRLKELASYITDSVDENGIYNACIKLGLIK